MKIVYLRINPGVQPIEYSVYVERDGDVDRYGRQQQRWLGRVKRVVVSFSGIQGCNGRAVGRVVSWRASRATGTTTIRFFGGPAGEDHTKHEFEVLGERPTRKAAVEDFLLPGNVLLVADEVTLP